MMAYFKTLIRYKHFILYGFCLSLLLFALKYLQWKFLIIDNSIDIYIGLIALLFTFLGIWVARQLTRPKTLIVEKEVYIQPEFIADQKQLDTLNLSQREWEVLQLIVKGLSNGEIAEKLFLSLSTIKTHASNVFIKMDVKSRTQAIDKARRLKITP